MKVIKDISFQNLYKKKSVQEFIAKSIDKKLLEIGDKHENELGVAIAPVYGNKTGIVTIISDDGDFETSKKLNELSKNYNVPKDCSPAAVYGYAREEGRMFKTHISVPTIYSYIKKGVFLNLTQKALPRHGVHKGDYKKVKTKGPTRAPAGESIEKRPEEVKTREEFGHWEMDTVYSGKRKSTVALLVLTERKTRNENIILVPNRRAETTVQAINALEKKLGAERFRAIYKSITVDNGTEFALADQLERSCITGGKRTKVYYCHPYSSWERGSNENVNGMIRRRHPKGTDFSKVTPEEIAATESWINSYPRKILGYKSAGTEFRECLRKLGLTA